MVTRNQVLGWIGAIVAIAIALTGCGGGGGGSSSGGTLLVVGMTPADGGVLDPNLPPGAVRSHEFKIFFSTQPDVATVLDAAEFNGLSSNIRFVDQTLTRGAGWAFLGGVDATGRTPAEVDPNIDPAWASEIAGDDATTLRFIYDVDGMLSTPDALPPAQYTIVVSPQVTNKSGRPILEQFCGSFTSGPDVYPPVVRFESPSNGATNVSVNDPYVIEFNEGVVASTVTENPPPGAITLGAQSIGGPGGGGPALVITGTTTGSPNNSCRYTFTPSTKLPGSSPGASVVVTATLATGLVRDFAGNILGPAPGMGVPPANTTSFTMEQGPTISNNPVPPNALWFGTTGPNSVGVVGINAVGTDAFSPILNVETDGDGIPTIADDNTVIATSVNTDVGRITDIVLGDFINTGLINPSCNVYPPGGFQQPIPSFGGTVITPPFPNPPASLPLGSTFCGLFDFCGGLIGLPNSSSSDIGSRVYVADTDNNVIRVLNSNTSLEIEQVPVPDPAGIAITAPLTDLLVSNFSTNSVSVFDLTTGSMVFVKEVNVNPTDPALAVGRGPKSIAGQPDNEDILVLNTRDETMSLLSPANGFEVRKVVASTIGPDPVEVSATWRQPPFVPFQGTGTWFAYISNRGGNSISVFESGPNFPVVIGPDDIKILLEGSTNFTIDEPTSVHTDLATGIFGDGVFVLNAGNGTVTHITLNFIGPPPSPYFPNPAPNRSWIEVFATQSFGPGVRDLAMGDNAFPCTGVGNANFKQNFGQYIFPIKGYVATSNSIRVFDAVTSLDLGVSIPVQGVNLLQTYMKQ